ncbi:MAG: glutamate--cysteine ligase [Deltaproteobacteria bacterium]|nr:glutamate--cysteine ligase [Deltaproteobacteria bacterium]
MIDDLSKKFKARQKELTLWYDTKAKGVLLPVTTSIDIRNAGFKIAVVDTNIFPAGFNNLCNNFSNITSEHFKNYFEAQAKGLKKIMIVPESFTRNMNYLENVRAIEKVLILAGFTVTVGYLGEPLSQNPLVVKLPSGATLTLEQVERKGETLHTKSMTPDLILLNNDCSEGIPEILKNITQPVFPSPELGWHSRRKKTHFEIYCQLVEEAAKILETDCWRMCPITRCERNIDIENPADLERLAVSVEKVLKRTKDKYEKYGIDQTPYAFIKSNAGTFGLGITHVSSPEEILNLNRKGRQKLQSGKGGVKPAEFIIQEGIPTIDSLENAPIEPVLYFVGGESVGGFFRIHEQKDSKSSLNAPGARFECLCFHKIKEVKPGELVLHCDDHEDFFTIAKWLGKIATLAAGLEEKELLLQSA